MKKESLTYDDFLKDVNLSQRPDVDQIHALLCEKGCETRLQAAKSGPVVSYDLPSGGKVVANYVFRKSGLMIRIYANQVGAYQELLEELPEEMRKKIAKSPVCRRLLDPAKCSPHCAMGNIFTLQGEEHKKCRYSAFLFLLNEDTTPHILRILARELDERASA